MINEISANAYCCEDISKIENYEKAVADKTQTWHCHHRGEVLPCGIYTPEDLKKFGLYYHRPANELIFLTNSDHTILHHKGLPLSEETRKKISTACKGQHRSEETRRKISAALKGQPRSEQHRKNLSAALKGKPLSEETKKKLSAASKGRIWWNNGVKTTLAFECPGPDWQKGRLKKKGR